MKNGIMKSPLPAHFQKWLLCLYIEKSKKQEKVNSEKYFMIDYSERNKPYRLFEEIFLLRRNIIYIEMLFSTKNPRQSIQRDSYVLRERYSMLTKVHSEMVETFFVTYEPQTVQETREL